MVPKIFWSVLYDGRGQDRIKQWLFRFAPHSYSIKMGVNFPEWPWSWWVTGAVKKSLTLRPKEISAMVQILWTVVVDRHIQPLQGNNLFFPCPGEVFPLTEGLLMGDPLSPLTFWSAAHARFHLVLNKLHRKKRPAKMTCLRKARETPLRFQKMLIFRCILGQKSGRISRRKCPLVKTKRIFNSFSSRKFQKVGLFLEAW